MKEKIELLQKEISDQLSKLKDEKELDELRIK